MAQDRTILQYPTEKTSFLKEMKASSPILSTIIIFVSTLFQQPLLILWVNPRTREPFWKFLLLLLFPFSYHFPPLPSSSSSSAEHPTTDLLLLLTTRSMAEQLIHIDSLMSIFIQMALRSTSLVTICLLSFSLAFHSLFDAYSWMSPCKF